MTAILGRSWFIATATTTPVEAKVAMVAQTIATFYAQAVIVNPQKVRETDTVVRQFSRLW